MTGSAHTRRRAMAVVVLLLAGIGASAAPATAGGVPQLINIEAAHHYGYDRMVFRFDRATAPAASVTSVPVLIGDFTGQVVPVPGRAVLRVVFRGAQAHTDEGKPTVDTSRAFALPSVMSLRPGGDFEAVITLGIGLAKAMPFHVHRLTNPGRVVVDVSTNFSWSWRTAYFLNRANYAVGKYPYVQGVARPVPTGYPMTGLLDRLFAGPTTAEENAGLRFVSSRATGFTAVSISNQIARLRLTGGCSSGGSTFTIASEIFPTLRPLSTVSWIKIYYPAGVTEQPTGNRDSIPSCLEP